MTVKQCFYVVLSIALFVVLCVRNINDVRPSDMECRKNLEYEVRLLLSYAKNHENQFPTELHQLAEDCQPCPVEGQACQPQYVVSSDRRGFGLWCPSVHPARGRTYDIAIAGDTDYQSGMTSLTRGDLADCRRQLKEESTFVKNSSSTDEPSLMGYKGYKSYACSYQHELTPCRDGSFEIICQSAHHMEDGLKPLQPRFRSREGKIQEEPRDVFLRPAPKSFLLTPDFPIGILLLTLVLMALRKNYASTERANPEKINSLL